MNFKAAWPVKAEIIESNEILSLKITTREGEEKIYQDFSKDREELTLFVHMINTCGVSKLHIEEIIDDFFE